MDQQLVVNVAAWQAGLGLLAAVATAVGIVLTALRRVLRPWVEEVVTRVVAEERKETARRIGAVYRELRHVIDREKLCRVEVERQIAEVRDSVAEDIKYIRDRLDTVLDRIAGGGL